MWFPLLWGCVESKDVSEDTNISLESVADSAVVEEPVEEEEEEEEPIEETPTETARLYRLTHTQWNNVVWDLLGLDGQEYSQDFIGGTLGTGFENDADTLLVSPILFQDYQRAAEGLSRNVIGGVADYQRVVPEDSRPNVIETAFTERLEAEDYTTDVGAVLSNNSGYNLWSEGILSMQTTLPYSGLYQFTAALRGSDCGDDIGARYELRVGGSIVLEGFVIGQQEFSVEIPLEADTYEVSIAFRND